MASQSLVFLFCLPPCLPPFLPRFLLMLEIKPRVLCMSGKCFTVELYLHFCFFSHNSEPPQTDHVAMDNFELPILMPTEPKCQDHEHAPPCPVYVVLGRESRTSGMLSFYQLSSTLSPPRFDCCYFHFLYFGVYAFKMLILRQGFSE